MDKCEIVLTPDVVGGREGLISFTVPKSSTDFTDLNLKVFLFRNFFSTRIDRRVFSFSCV